MERIAQKRLVRRLDLEKALAQIEPHPSPKANLEQYTIPTNIAAELLFIAAYVHGDIAEKIVADLGCGTGRLAIGAVLLGAAEAVGVDIDRAAVKIAKDNAEKLNLKEKTNWVAGDIDVLHGNFHTVLQNPPFGVQKRRADRKFLLKALELASRVYSLHKGGESNRAFIKRFIEGHGGKVTGIFPMKLNIPKLFKFHTERKHEVKVDLYRIIRA
jgi:putative methylase